VQYTIVQLQWYKNNYSNESHRIEFSIY